MSVLKTQVFILQTAEPGLAACPPPAEYGGQTGGDDRAESDVSETNEITRQYVLGPFVSQKKKRKIATARKMGFLRNCAGKT
jgi:hypothetical protein